MITGNIRSPPLVLCDQKVAKKREQPRLVQLGNKAIGVIDWLSLFFFVDVQNVCFHLFFQFVGIFLECMINGGNMKVKM